MATYERFQTLSSAQQELFLPEGPVWVSRWQLSRDLESGKRLLQVRMVNSSERTLRQIFLRIVCLGAKREKLNQLELVPMPAASVRPGRVFGDDKPLEIPVKGTVYVEVFAQRVRFADGGAWDEPADAAYQPFKPEPVRKDDPHRDELSARALSGNVRNDCYYRIRQGLWACTCGMPNAVRDQRCVRCGADRRWLERHMDVNLMDEPEPVRAAAPVPAPAAPSPAVTVVPAPLYDYTPAQPTIIVQPSPEPQAPEAPVSHAGRNAAILASVLLFLALAAFCAYKYLLPLLRYREALKEQAAGNYEKAVSLFEDLGDYRDSAEQINKTLARKASHLMADGKYQEAMELYESLGGHDKEIADCLYSLGVLAYNDKDLQKALSYVETLRQRYPDYDKTETLEQYCYYSMANQNAALAAEATDPAQRISLLTEAMQLFDNCAGYEDSAERAQECLYRIAVTQSDMGQPEDAVETFRQLSGYKNADELRRECMFSYVQQHVEDYQTDALAAAYLRELAAEGYPDAVALQARLSGDGFKFYVTLGPEQSSPSPAEVSDLSQVYIHYNVDVKDSDGTALVLLRCQMPDGKTSRTLLNNDRSARGSRAWTEIPLPTTFTQDGVVVLEFFDAMLGENAAPLETVSFRYVKPAASDTTNPVPGK